MKTQRYDLAELNELYTSDEELREQARVLAGEKSFSPGKAALVISGLSVISWVIAIWTFYGIYLFITAVIR